MPKDKTVRLEVRHHQLRRFERSVVQAGQATGAQYWFPHAPLAVAVAGAGFYLLAILFTHQKYVLMADFPKHIFDFRPTSMPYVLIGVGMMIMSIGLVLRSRVAWIITVVLTVSTVLSALIVGHQHQKLLIYYDGALLICLLLSYRWFRRSSLAAGTLFAVASTFMLLIYAVFGCLYFGREFNPPIKDLVTALYFAVVTMGTVGYGDITPQGPEARLFIVSVIILGVAVFATSVTAVAGPMVARLSTRKEKRMKRSNHFIVVGATPLAYNAYREFKKRGQTVTLIVPHLPEGLDIDADDLLIGDPHSLDTLTKANADAAQAVLAMRADDSDNAFIVLAVKELKGRAKTVVAVSDSKSLERVKLVHPDIVIAPDVLGGELLAMMLSGEAITADFLMERILRFDRPPEQAS